MFLFMVPPFIIGTIIGRRWAVPITTIGWPGLYLLDGRGIGPTVLVYAATGTLGCAVGVWLRRAMYEETIGSKDEWSAWWHDRGWRQH